MWGGYLSTEEYLRSVWCKAYDLKVLKWSGHHWKVLHEHKALNCH